MQVYLGLDKVGLSIGAITCLFVSCFSQINMLAEGMDRQRSISLKGLENH